MPKSALQVRLARRFSNAGISSSLQLVKPVDACTGWTPIVGSMRRYSLLTAKRRRICGIKRRILATCGSFASARARYVLCPLDVLHAPGAVPLQPSVGHAAIRLVGGVTSVTTWLRLWLMQSASDVPEATALDVARCLSMCRAGATSILALEIRLAGEPCRAMRLICRPS